MPSQEEVKAKAKDIEKLLMNTFVKQNLFQGVASLAGEEMRSTIKTEMAVKPSLKILKDGGFSALKKDNGTLPVLPKSLRSELLCKIETALAANQNKAKSGGAKYTPETINKVRNAFFTAVVKLLMTY